MHFNNKNVRDELLKKMPNHFYFNNKKVLGFINLCIYPLRFELIYSQIRENSIIANTTYDGLKGALAGMLVLTRRKGRFYQNIVDEAIVDWVEFIRMDKTPNAEKFLLNFRNYMPRYLLIKGLKIAFNVDWREVVFNALTLKQLPKPRTYHSLLTNQYLREIMKSYIVYKKFRECNDEDYKEGVNDLVTIFNEQLAKSTLKPDQFTSLYDTLVASLPSWNTSVRKKAAFAIDNFLDGYYIINVSFNTNMESELNKQSESEAEANNYEEEEK
jgi:hypothetical protein